MYRGVSRLLGMDIAEPAETDAGSIDVLADQLKTHDFAFVHFKYIDSRGEDGDFDAKVAAIEAVDELIPGVEALNPDVIVVTGDHSTPSRLRAHSWHPVPTMIVSPWCRPADVDGLRRAGVRCGASWALRSEAPHDPRPRPRRPPGQVRRMSADGAGARTWRASPPGLELGEEERWEEMATLLAETLEEEEDDPYLLCWLGVAEGELGNDGAAYDAFRRCVELEPSDPNILALAGAGLAEFDDPDAETALRAAALSAPDLPLARLNYGAYLARAGMHEEALEQLGPRGTCPRRPRGPGRAGRRPRPPGRAPRGSASSRRRWPSPPTTPGPASSTASSSSSWTGRRRPPRSWSGPAGARARREAIILGALAAASQDWDDAAEELLARAEYAVEGVDIKLIEEAEAAVRAPTPPVASC
jgi:hypothetical protein